VQRTRCPTTGISTLGRQFVIWKTAQRHDIAASVRPRRPACVDLWNPAISSGWHSRHLTGANLSDTDLTGANLSRASLVDTAVSQDQLDQACVANPRRCRRG
jgi:uncharacterized protein YjbI with pentapeptide repeats